MKFYATTASERASKGQGGQKYLRIDITNEQSEVIAHISVDATTEDSAELVINNFIAGRHTNDKFKITKGKKKTGNQCKYNHAICLQTNGKCIDTQ